MATKRDGAGLWRYLREAFCFRWNLLIGAGAAAAAWLSPAPEVLLPLVGAAEVLYLVGLTSIPRFRSAVDARDHAARHGARAAEGAPPDAGRTLETLVGGLAADARRRFEALRQRCLEMRSIAKGVGGRGGEGRGTADEVADPGLDRLLWMFLRMLSSQGALERFLRSTDEAEIRRKLDESRARLAEADAGGDERLVRSLRDSLATRELQLENLGKARSNAEFVAIELDRLEAKIQTLSEMAVNRQDPDFISREVDSVAASIQHTEKAMEELHLVDGMLDDLAEPPPILRAGLKEVE